MVVINYTAYTSWRTFRNMRSIQQQKRQLGSLYYAAPNRSDRYQLTWTVVTRSVAATPTVLLP